MAETSTGEETLAKTRKLKPDVLLMDVIMPEMTGWDLAQKLVSFCPHIKSLFMSGYTFNNIALLGKLDTHVHFIQKPFTKNELATKIHEALKSEIENLNG